MTIDELIRNLTVRKPDPAGIEKLESRLGVRLPEDYRQFLLKRNGGKAKKPIGWEGGDIERFLGTKESLFRPGNELQEEGVFVPDELLPITAAGYDVLIACLAIRGEFAGRVFLWFSDSEPLDEDFDLANVHELQKLAPSFTEFVESIRFTNTVEEAPAPVDERGRLIITEGFHIIRHGVGFHREPAATEEMIQEAEKELQIRFPDDLREHYLEVNGGSPIEYCFTVRAEEPPYQLKIFSKVPTDLVKQMQEVRSEWSLPKDLLPLGQASCLALRPVGYVCVGVEGEVKDKVLFFQEGQLVEIADSFGEFLEKKVERLHETEFWKRVEAERQARKKLYGYS